MWQCLYRRERSEHSATSPKRPAEKLRYDVLIGQIRRKMGEITSRKKLIANTIRPYLPYLGSNTILMF
jgi:hypothetical protein